MLSITFSCFVGVASALTPTSASFTDSDAVPDNSLTAACWEDPKEHKTPHDHSGHTHERILVDCTTGEPLTAKSSSSGDGLFSFSSESDLGSFTETVEAGHVAPPPGQQPPQASNPLPQPAPHEEPQPAPHEAPQTAPHEAPQEAPLPEPQPEPQPVDAEPQQSQPQPPAEPSAQDGKDVQAQVPAAAEAHASNATSTSAQQDTETSVGITD